MIKIVSLVATIIIHTVVVFWLLWTPKHLVEKAPAGGEIEYIFTEPRLIESTIEGTACQKSYRGIGVMINYGSLQVVQVVKGGPADKAGVLLGDIILDDYFNQHSKGTEVVINVIRNGKTLQLKTIVDDICYE